MIYAISDIHGDYKQAKKLLNQHGVIDEEGNWCAGDSVLVCGGDSTDRGSKGIETLRGWFNLTKQAREVGGTVIHLMGNHDALILCVALHFYEGDYDPEHAMVFQGNGGKMHEAKSLSNLSDLRRFVQSFPLMCIVDNILFQHCDGFIFYEEITKDSETPEEKIKAANLFCRQKCAHSWGAWNTFYELTDERRWNRKPQYLPEYLDKFDCDMVVHGHSSFIGSEPLLYQNGLAVNIDAVLSRGYRNDDNRGCVFVSDSPGTKIIV